MAGSAAALVVFASWLAHPAWAEPASAQAAHVAGNRLKPEGTLPHAGMGKLCAENYAALRKDLKERTAARQAPVA